MGYLFVAIYCFVAIWALKYDGIKSIIFLTVICFFQNFIILLMARLINSSMYSILCLVKEAYVVLYIIKYILIRKKINREMLFCIISIMSLLMLLVLYGSGKLMGQLTSFRQLYLPFLFYAFGQSTRINKDKFKDICRVYLKLCFWTIIFGYIEMIMGAKLWTPLGLKYYAKVKGNEAFINGGLYKSFFTYDFFGIKLRRMASFLVDPVILGQLLSFGFLISVFCKDIYKNEKEKTYMIVIISSGLILTWAKGGIVIAIVAFCFLLGKVQNKKGLSILLLATAGFAFIIFAYQSIQNELSGSAHINGLISGLKTFLKHPFGTGIGSAGNMADAYGGFGYQAVAGDESYIGSMLAQTGVIGLVLNCIFWKKFCGKEKKNIVGDYKSVLKISNLAVLLTSFFNYTAISFTSCFIFIIMFSSTRVSFNSKRFSQLIGRNKEACQVFLQK